MRQVLLKQTFLRLHLCVKILPLPGSDLLLTRRDKLLNAIMQLVLGLTGDPSLNLCTINFSWVHKDTLTVLNEQHVGKLISLENAA